MVWFKLEWNAEDHLSHLDDSSSWMSPICGRLE